MNPNAGQHRGMVRDGVRPGGPYTFDLEPHSTQPLLVPADPVAPQLHEQGLVEKGEALHGARIIRTAGRVAVRHLQEFRVGGFEIVDRLVGEAFGANSFDAIDDGIAHLGRNAGKRV